MFEKLLFYTIFSMMILLQANVCADTQDLLLILNQSEEQMLELSRFRTMADPFKMTFHGHVPSREGLASLRASGSAQFSKQGFLKLIHMKQLLIIDLRQESHGFLNDMPVSWYARNDWANKGRSLEFIEADEKKRLNQLLERKTAVVHQLMHDHGDIDIREIIVDVHSTSTEKELCNCYGVHYLRIPVTDHFPPANSQVDQFMALVKSLPSNAWIHIHCGGGMGRTTTFLCMFDMMHNARKVSFEDILTRQWLLGGQNFISQTSRSFNRWPDQFILRTKMLKLFYDYCQQQMGQFSIGWTEWLHAAGIHEFDSVN